MSDDITRARLARDLHEASSALPDAASGLQRAEELIRGALLAIGFSPAYVELQMVALVEDWATDAPEPSWVTDVRTMRARIDELEHQLAQLTPG